MINSSESVSRSAILLPESIRDLVWGSEPFQDLVLNDAGDPDLDLFVNLSDQQIELLAKNLIQFIEQDSTNEDLLDESSWGKENERQSKSLFIIQNLLLTTRDTFRTSKTDGLTGLFNKKAFEKAFDRKINQFQEQDSLSENRRSNSRFEKGAALLEIDLDRFKPFNDVFNYQIGDRAIIATAEMLKSEIRERDIAGRVGGDEYLLIISDVNEAAAEIIAERLRSRFEELYIEIDASQSINLTPNQCKILGKESDQKLQVTDLSVDEFRKVQMQIEFHGDKCKLFIGGSVGKAMVTADKTRSEVEIEAGKDRKNKKQYWDNAGREPTGP